MDWDVSNQEVSEVTYTEDGTYVWSISPKDSPTGGGGVTIYPIGVDVTGFIFHEDNTTEIGILSTNKETIRMSHGQQAPDNEGVYTKR